MNALMEALKDVVSKGGKFTLTQHSENPSMATLCVASDVSDHSLRIGCDLGDVKGFHWESSLCTGRLFISAVEGMPDDAEPKLILNTEEWEEGGLILTGTWSQKARGRSTKGATEHHRSFLIDAGVLAVRK